jgi:hypothetical protein
MRAMKKRMGVLIFLFFTGLILGTMQPAMVFAGQTSGGNIWDQFVDPKPYPGVWFYGPLSIYYEFIDDDPSDPSCPGDTLTIMYYTVRLNKVLDILRPNPTLYTFQGTTGICLNDWISQGTEIRNFLGTVVVPGIFPNGFQSWKLMSITKAQYHDEEGISRAFVADIVIAVKK